MAKGRLTAGDKNAIARSVKQYEATCGKIRELTRKIAGLANELGREETRFIAMRDLIRERLMNEVDPDGEGIERSDAADSLEELQLPSISDKVVDYQSQLVSEIREELGGLKRALAGAVG